MTTISTSIRLESNMTRIIEATAYAANSLIESFKEMQSSGNQAINTGIYRDVKNEIIAIDSKFQELASNIQNINSGQSAFNDNLRSGNNLINNFVLRLRDAIATYLSLQQIQSNLNASGQDSANAENIVGSSPTEESVSLASKLAQNFGIGGIGEGILNAAFDKAPVLANFVEPIITGADGASAAYDTISSGMEKMKSISEALKTIQEVRSEAAKAGLAGEKVATFGAIEAQNGFNIALLSSPMGWILIGIMLVVAALAIWIQHLGGVKVAWLMLVNWIMTGLENCAIQNTEKLNNMIDRWQTFAYQISAVKTNILNALGDLKADGLMLLQTFVNGAIDYVNSLIGSVNLVLGTSIETVEHVTFGADAAANNAMEKEQRNKELLEKKEELERQRAEREAKLNAMKTEAKNRAAERQIEIKNAKAESAAKSESMVDTNPGSLMNPNVSAATFNSDAMNTLSMGMSQTSDNTGKMANTMEMSGEDLKYLRDVAEREVINRFTTADLSVTMQTTANVNSGLDIDGIISQLEDKTYEMLVSTAEGV